MIREIDPKSGAIMMDARAFTNLFSCSLPPGVAEVRMRPLNPDELDDMEDHIMGIDRKTLPKTRYTIDGSFDDWKNSKTASLVSRAAQTTFGDSADAASSFAVTRLDFSNDENFLYVFLQFKPSVQQRYDSLNLKGKSRRIGNVGWLYIDTDADPKTGAHPSVIAGTDLMISISAAAYVRKDDSGSLVRYQISNGETDSKNFGSRSRSETSARKSALIQHGKDGVEIAVLLSDIQLRKGKSLIAVFRDGGRVFNLAAKIE